MRAAVALVPGFLGFDHVKGFTYWADRFVAGLRGHVEARLQGPVPVFPLPCKPLGSLAARQRELVKNLRELDARPGGPYRWHLVGHSTGGVDAALLARTAPLVETGDGSAFAPGEPAPAESLTIASITTISAPHYGTCLALTPLACMRRGHFTLAGARQAGQVLSDVVWRGDDKLGERVKFALGSALEGSTIKFVTDLVLHDHLAGDLRPEVCAKLTATPNRRGDVPIFCVASMTPRPTPALDDNLFRDMWTLTQEEADAARPAAPAVSWERSKVIAAGGAPDPLSVGPRDNDGVVNTDRQIDRDGGNASLAALVFADHGDVIGLYQRNDAFSGKTIEPGLLTSGARFGDDEFFRLLGRVAEGIASSVA